MYVDTYLVLSTLSHG